MTFEPYLQLGKFRLSLLVTFTAAIGYGIAADEIVLMTWLGLVLGTLLMSMAANGLNQWFERERDALMQRTRLRPIPRGVLSPAQALAGSCGMGLFGLVTLLLTTTQFTAALAILTLFIYLGIYTPLKTRSPVAILVGAIPGAIPVLMGWSAASGQITPAAMTLFWLLFLWQIPHFLALATMYQEDYRRGGYQMLPDDPQQGYATRSVLVVFSVALFAISLCAPLAGVGNIGYLLGASTVGGWLLILTAKFYREANQRNARRVFLCSVVYLPAVLALLLFDQFLTLFPQ